MDYSIEGTADQERVRQLCGIIYEEHLHHYGSMYNWSMGLSPVLAVAVASNRYGYIGAAMVVRPIPTYEFNMGVWVTENCRRMGIGRALVQKLESLYTGTLIPWTESELALDFYSAIGKVA